MSTRERPCNHRDALTAIGAGVGAWLLPGPTSAEQVAPPKKTHLVTLSFDDGFKKIAAVCNGARLVFSDHPPDRSKGGWKDWAFVYKSEAMDVVYLQGAYLKAAKRSGTLWKCALTIIHELSHREVKTDDNRYDYDGLKPDKSSFPHAKALDNADSWAYFALDYVGTLPAGDRDDVLARVLQLAADRIEPGRPIRLLGLRAEMAMPDDARDGHTPTRGGW